MLKALKLLVSSGNSFNKLLSGIETPKRVL